MHCDPVEVAISRLCRDRSPPPYHAVSGKGDARVVKKAGLKAVTL